MKAGKQPVQFVFVTLLFLALAGLFIWAFVSLAISKGYPPAESLELEECTVVEYELITASKSSYYFIYVEEYEKPLEIGNVTKNVINREVLLELKAGDTIVVSYYEGKRSLNLYSLAHGEKTILAYEDYLAEHGVNNTVGIWITGALFLASIALLIVNTLHYKKTGECISLIGRYRAY